MGLYRNLSFSNYLTGLLLHFLFPSPSPPPACAADPSSAAPPVPVSPAVSAGSSASPRGRSATAACCAHSGSPGCSPPVRKSSPERTGGCIKKHSVCNSAASALVRPHLATSRRCQLGEFTLKVLEVFVGQTFGIL